MYFSDNWMQGELIVDALEVIELPPGNELAESDFAHGYRMRAAGVQDIGRVFDSAGASLIRDSADARVVADVRAATGRIIDDVSDTPGWPPLASSPAPRDSDGDGMPDDWETSIGLDPADGSDGASDRDGDGYTNLEDYLNSLVPTPSYDY